MNKLLLALMLASGVLTMSSPAMAFDMGATMRQCRGCDNPAGHIRQGRGADDPVGHIRQGRGADDIGGARGVHADGHISGRDRIRTPNVGDASGRGRGRGRGGDNPVGHIRGGNGYGNAMGAVGTTNPAGHVRGRGADDVGGARGVHADGHISGRDRARSMGAMGMLGR